MFKYSNNHAHHWSSWKLRLDIVSMYHVVWWVRFHVVSVSTGAGEGQGGREEGASAGETEGTDVHGRPDQPRPHILRKS